MATNDKQQEIREAAAALLAAAHITSPPVDLAAVARVQGIERISTRKMRRTLGTLREGPTGLTVTLNGREPFRARFTLAHEIAHTMVDVTGSSMVTLARRKPRSHNDLERLCDEIAVELLLPYEMFLGAMGDEPLALGSVFRLAKEFDSSLQATALRAGELSRAPVEVVVWERAGRGMIRAKAKRGREWLTGPDADAKRSVDDSTPIAKAFRSKETERGQELPSPESPLAYDCEARGFLRGTARFVISIMRPATLAAPTRPQPPAGLIRKRDLSKART